MIASLQKQKTRRIASGGFEWCAGLKGSFQGNGTHGPPDARIRCMRIRVVLVWLVTGVHCGMLGV
jgi:uncharacterized protein (DUF2461 family)